MPRVTTEPVPGIRVIDTRMGGRPGVTSAYLVAAREPALIETGPTTSLEPVAAGLGELGVEPGDLAHIVVTHVHLDHAGGVGGFVRRFPNAIVWVHERGAPHLVEPSKLVRSATMVFGPEHMNRVFGPVEAVPSDRVRPADDGDTVDLGDRRLQLLHAPGHAKHHMFVVDQETGALWTGDGLGVYLPDVRVLRPGMPPPDFDLDEAIRSVELVARRSPPVIMFSHYGPAREVEHLCDLAIERMRGWAAIVKEAMRTTGDVAEVVERLRAETVAELPPGEDAGDRYDILTTYEMNAQGLMRYFARAHKHAHDLPPRREAGAGDAPERGMGDH